jgi:hypothetical protein
MCYQQALLEKAFWAGVVAGAAAAGVQVSNGGSVVQQATQLREYDVGGEVARKLNELLWSGNGRN